MLVRQSFFFTFIFFSCRKVTSESATGSSSSERVRTTLTLSVEGIEYDSPACELRVKGRNIQENPYVKMGAYHTIDLTINQKFTLAKNYWDSVALDRLGKPFIQFMRALCDSHVTTMQILPVILPDQLMLQPW